MRTFFKITIPTLVLLFLLTLITAIFSLTLSGKGGGSIVDPKIPFPENLDLRLEAVGDTELDLVIDEQSNISNSESYYLASMWDSKTPSEKITKKENCDGFQPIVFDGLIKDDLYVVQTSIVDENGNISESSKPVSKKAGDHNPPPPVDKPDTPTNLTVSTIDDSSLQVTYDEVIFGSDQIKYDLKWGESSGSYTTTQNDISGTSYNVSGLEPDKTYYFEVRSVDKNTGEHSEWSTEASGTTDSTPLPTPLDPPTGLVVTTTDQTSLDVTYDPVTYGTDTIKYDVRWKQEGQQYDDTNIEKEINGTSYTIEGLTASTTYQVEVRTNDMTSSDQSVWSTEVSATTKDDPVDPQPSTPINLSVVVNADDPKHKLDVSFDNSTISSGTIDHYVVSYQNNDTSSTWVDKTTTTNSYTIESLDSGTNYNVKVRAVSDKGVESSYTSIVTCQTESESTEGPTTPDLTSVTPQGDSSLDIDFSDSTSEGSTIEKYNIDAKISGTPTFTIHESTPDSTSEYNLAGLSADTTYTIRVQAVDAAGSMSSWSNQLDGTTDPSAVIFPDLPTTVEIPDLSFESAKGYGNGRRWGDKSFAPFVDMGDYWGWDSDKGGMVPDLKAMNAYAHNSEFQLGFIDSLGGVRNGLYAEENDVLKWGWGGNPSLSFEPSPDSTQFDNIGKSIKDYRDTGGDVSISIGGASGVPFWDESQNVNVLARTYEEIIKYYGLSTLDLDIEGNGMSIENNKINAKAIKQVQLDTGVDITLTLPIGQQGLDSGGLGPQVLQAYIDEGVNIKFINGMAMVFDEDIGGSRDNPIDEYAIKAMESLNDQIKSAYSQVGKELSTEEAYALEGSITSIGEERDDLTIETSAMFKNVVDDAIDKGFGMMSYWAENRDAYDMNDKSHYFKNNGVHSKGEFSDVVNDEGFMPSVSSSVNVNESNETPLAVENLSATAGFDDATLTWNNPSENNSDIFYDVYLAREGDSEYKFVGRTADETFHIPKLEGGDKEYSVDVAAVNPQGDFAFTGDKPIFSIQDYSGDSTPPVFESGSEITPKKDSKTYYTDKYLSFDPAIDSESSVAKYNISVTGGGFGEKKITIDSGDWYQYDKINFGILTDFLVGPYNEKGTISWGLSPDADYNISIVATDVNGNASTPLTYQFHTDPKPTYDRNESLDNKYHLGLILTNPKDGELYQKIKPWGGYDPDEFDPGSYSWDGGKEYPSELTAWWKESVPAPTFFSGKDNKSSDEIIKFLTGLKINIVSLPTMFNWK